MKIDIKSQAIIDILNKINTHPSLNNYLAIDDDGNKWLNIIPMTGILRHTNAEFESLVEKLDELCCKHLITNDGQHSEVFFEIRKYGVYSKTGERDSFGPLSSIIALKDKPWVYVYG